MSESAQGVAILSSWCVGVWVIATLFHVYPLDYPLAWWHIPWSLTATLAGFTSAAVTNAGLVKIFKWLEKK
jgi:hypothetical protein